MTYQELLDEDKSEMAALYVRCLSWINSERNTICPDLIPLRPEKTDPTKEDLAVLLHSLCTFGWYVSLMNWKTKHIKFSSLAELDLKLSILGF